MADRALALRCRAQLPAQGTVACGMPLFKVFMACVPRGTFHGGSTDGACQVSPRTGLSALRLWENAVNKLVLSAAKKTCGIVKKTGNVPRGTIARFIYLWDADANQICDSYKNFFSLFKPFICLWEKFHEFCSTWNNCTDHLFFTRRQGRLVGKIQKCSTWNISLWERVKKGYFHPLKTPGLSRVFHVEQLPHRYNIYVNFARI